MTKEQIADNIQRFARMFYRRHRDIRNDINWITGNYKRMSPLKWQKVDIINRDKSTCQYCLQSTDKPIIEHVIPVCRGGYADNENLVVSCNDCNYIKSSKVWIPKNIKVLRKINKEHAALIRKIAKQDAKLTG